MHVSGDRPPTLIYLPEDEQEVNKAFRPYSRHICDKRVAEHNEERHISGWRKRDRVMQILKQRVFTTDGARPKSVGRVPVRPVSKGRPVVTPRSPFPSIESILPELDDLGEMPGGPDPR